MVSKDDWVQIRNSEVWQEHLNSLAEAVSRGGAELINRTEPNEARDMFVRGYVRALIEMMEWEPTFEEVEIQEEA